MEATALSIGKSVLDGALGYAKSALAEEVALQLGVWRDQVFITNELEMMQAFLMTAHDERYDDDRVVKVWVKQVRDVAYDVEDTLQEFSVCIEKQSWWRIRRTLLERRRVAKQMKELRANVEDVSQRNMRYHLITGYGSKNATTDGKPVIAGIGDLGETSIIKRVYEDPEIHKKFECRARVTGLMRPFNSTEFLKSVVEQFYINFLQEEGKEEKAALGTQVLKIMGMMKKIYFAHEFKKFLKERSYFIVLNDVVTIEEWDRIKTCFPDNKKGSLILFSTEQIGVASLCVGAENGAPEHKQLFADQTLHVFYKKSC
ncbi:Disease resistance protein RPM1 [Triticum urartu]|uniref:Disease resistance protein RPM1 n=1 Tax=Triticum urartu TaxID=4572 RepID=M7YHC2_TRIUA|nr:Disease resistance protein RPM1 [Triticum urartu]